MDNRYIVPLKYGQSLCNKNAPEQDAFFSYYRILGVFLRIISKKNGNVLFSRLNERIDFHPPANERGGVIVFSTDVNAVQMDEQKVINLLKQKMQTITNRINLPKKIDRLAISHDLIGWTIGKYLNGRYTADNGKQYGENSLSLEFFGVSCATLIKSAEELCTLFGQESALVKDYASGSVMFVKPLKRGLHISCPNR